MPPSLARRRPPDRPLATHGDPTSSSIAGRRASGFLQVSLSKVPRHQSRATGRTSRAEVLPMNANDFNANDLWGVRWTRAVDRLRQKRPALFQNRLPMGEMKTPTRPLPMGVLLQALRKRWSAPGTRATRPRSANRSNHLMWFSTLAVQITSHLSAATLYNGRQLADEDRPLREVLPNRKS